MNAFLPLGYIDPGSGTILLQVLLAALIGSAAFMGKIVAFVKRLIRPGAQASPPSKSASANEDSPGEQRRAA